MRMKPPSDLRDGYFDLSGLYVEWDYATSCSDPGNADGDLYICNVQWPDPNEPENTDKWLDITDRLTDEQTECLRQQVIETLECWMHG